MSRAVFFWELYNRKVLPKGCLTLLNSVLLGSEKLSLCWDMHPKEGGKLHYYKFIWRFYTQLQNIELLDFH